ncbi:MAG: hypothetical protein ABFD98_00400 [Syntrophobacteraceae bacterium]|nr:hypothetical protein [Desulfobacteraceae bacterium]
MRQIEPYYQNTRSESFQPRQYPTRQRSGGMPDEIAGERIVALYESGHSIESISRETGRARHFVVHLLQSRGIFGNRPVTVENTAAVEETAVVEEPSAVEAPAVVEEAAEEPAAVERKPEPAVVQAEAESAAEERPVKKVRLRKPRTPKAEKALPVESPEPAAPESSEQGGWSPELVEALIKVASKPDLKTGVSRKQVKKMVSKPRQ